MTISNQSLALDYFNSTSRQENGMDDRKLFAYIVFFLACLLLASFVIISNILFILACSKTRALRTIANKHVHSLAVADMILGLAMYTQGAFYISINGGSLHSIKYLCLTLMSTTSIGLTSSFLSVMLIAIDRYIYIVFPYRYPRLVTARRTTVVIVVAWALSFLYGLVPMYNNHFNQEKGCGPNSSTDNSYAASRLILFLVASSISGFCHISIQLTAMRHIKKLYPTRHHQARPLGSPSDSHNSHMNKANKHMVAALKPIKSFFFVYVLFVYSWMPGLVAYTIGSSHKILLQAFAILAELSTGLNVLVYVFSNRQFKVAIGNIMGCSRQSISSTTSM